MPSNNNKRTHKNFNYENIYLNYQRVQFEVEDYIDNPSMIKKLNEEKEIAHAYASSLEELLDVANFNKQKSELQKKESGIKLEEANQVIEGLREDKKLINIELSETKSKLENLQLDKHTLDLELTKVTEKLQQANRNSLIQFVVSTTATVTLAIGVNIVTSTPNDWKGWIFIIIGIILGIIAFYISRKSK
jgi:hypothetical protein